mmetsp:Transcript_7995/g.35465  ORF Transcript_7995/g.35465 Transcript_7995/m.35465 type:complete len:218 (-) Transcript_7995:4623-5276(-)
MELALRFSVCIIVCGLAAAGSLQGMNEQAIRKLKDGSLQCQSAHDSHMILMLSEDEVNDEFCDCADGTDEPGTSACPNGKFLCAAEPLHKVINSTWVNDGVCDCCDGSDEFQGRLECDNKCKQIRADLLKEYSSKMERARRGLQMKSNLSADGQHRYKQSTENAKNAEKKSVEVRADLSTLERMIVTLENSLGRMLAPQLPSLCPSASRAVLHICLF